jgi:ligand-binding sensor protein
MTDMSARRKEAQKALLDLFATVTGLPIGLYELHDGKLESIFSEHSLANFEPHCQLIQSLPGGKKLCDDDQCNRARFALNSRDERLTLCHAGLYNQALPVRVGGEVRAVLLYGEMHIEGEKYEQETLERHRQVVARLNLDEEQATELRRLLLGAKKYTPQQLEHLKAALPRIEQWFYTLIDEEDRLKRNVDKVTHEIQTRLQAVIANAENLATEITLLSADEARKRANDVLNSALALDTVVQNLGEYLEEYLFLKPPIAPLLL